MIGWWLNNELERAWKEAVVSLFEVLYQHLSWGLKKTTKILSQNRRSLGQYLNPGPPEFESGLPTTLRRLAVMVTKFPIFRCYLYNFCS
jgi:hypothetical protein